MNPVLVSVVSSKICLKSFYLRHARNSVSNSAIRNANREGYFICGFVMDDRIVRCEARARFLTDCKEENFTMCTFIITNGRESLDKRV